MAANGNLIFQDTNKATFVGANSNVVIDTVHASFGVGVDVNGPTSNLHVVGNAYVTSNLEVGTANLFVDTVNSRVGIGTTTPDETLSIYKEDTTADGQTVISSITGVFSGSDATGGNINNRGLYINLDSSATGGTATNTEEHRVWGIDVDIDVTGDSDDIRGGRFLVRSEMAANGTDQNTNIYGIDSQGQHNGTGPCTNIIGVNARSLKGSSSTGLTDTMVGVTAESEINAGTCTDAYGVRSRFDRNGGAVTNSYLFYGDHLGSTTTITNNYGLYVTSADKHYLEGNVGIGTANPQVDLEIENVNGSPELRFTDPFSGTTAAWDARSNVLGEISWYSRDSQFTDSYGKVASITSKHFDDGFPDGALCFTTSTNGVLNEDAMVIDQTGNVGVGTTSPNATLHIKNETESSGTGDVYLPGVINKPTECLRLQNKWHNTGSGALLRFTNQHPQGTNPSTGEYNLAGIAGYDHDGSWGGGLAFYTSPGSGSGGDDLTLRMSIDSTGAVNIPGPTTGAAHGSASMLYLLDTCFFKEWSYANYVAPTVKVTFNTSTEIPDGAKAVLAEVFLSRDDLTNGDHQIHVLGKNHLGNQTNWRGGAGQPSTAFSADVDVRQTVELLMPGESDGFTHYFGKWHSSVIIPLENNKIYYSNKGNSSSTGWVYMRVRGYYI